MAGRTPIVTWRAGAAERRHLVDGAQLRLRLVAPDAAVAGQGGRNGSEGGCAERLGEHRDGDAGLARRDRAGEADEAGRRRSAVVGVVRFTLAGVEKETSVPRAVPALFAATRR